MKDGSAFEGEFENDEANGDGRYTDKWSNTYSIPDKNSGSFKKGELFGQGKAVLKCGDEYRGAFKCGKFNGKGVMSYRQLSGYKQAGKENGVYDGEWANSIRSGTGRMKWSDASIFEGEWRDDARVRGRLKAGVGLVYEGCWKRGLFDGKGKVTVRNSLVVVCVFEEGKAPCKVKVRYKDDSVYYGSVR